MLQRTPPSIDLTTFSLPSAFSLAVSMSGKADWDIAAQMSWSSSTAARIFNGSDDYWPSLPSLPRLCCVLGNTVLLDWIAAQAGEPIAFVSASIDVPQLLERLRGILIEVGDVSSVTGEAVADGVIDRREARRLVREIEHLISEAAPLLAGARSIIEEPKP